MTTTAGFFAPRSDTEQAAKDLKDELLGLIKSRSSATPRHRQVELGPSDIAHPCMRRLGYGLLQIERCNPEWDPLASIIGTATHSWLESAATHANNTLGRNRWLTEVRVNPAPWLQGSCDLYDTDTETVIDWKVLGNTTFKRYCKAMNPQYRTQTQLYGKGFANAGRPVKNVGVFMVPRSGMLANSFLWMQPYDPAAAQEALDRRDQVVALLNDLEIEKNPERFAWLAKSGPSCMFCKYFAPNPASPYQCEGSGDDH
ncbi:hypothetical protein [Mycolicibacterium sphagni]|uniref:hypothetical protein n=1 Tax=Mycolicibacterium sphagni TaxID=1786 RepID=UPI0021F3307E|nr:hypothetical protein [Mycolicibacterium sphagni]MCV7175714.1 hypothetical protein [Mycolicibacterium sphagni]